MPDQTHGVFVGFDGPYAFAAPITPDDTNPLENFALALLIGGAGNINVILRGMTEPVVIPVVATTDNKPMKLLVKQVMATGTTATGLIALW